jgi:Predicted membrane protein
MFALPVVAVVLYLRGLHSRPPTATPERDPAMDVLRQRFAKGEIDEVEYKRLRSALQGH